MVFTNRGGASDGAAGLAVGKGLAVGNVLGVSARLGRGVTGLALGNKPDESFLTVTRGRRPLLLPVANGLSASTTSLTLPKRLSGAFCIKRSATSTRAWGTSGFNSNKGLGCWNW